MTMHDPTLEPTIDVSEIPGATTGMPIADALEKRIHELPGHLDSAKMEGKMRAYGVASIYFPPGNYVFERGIRIPANKPVALIGAGSGVSVITLLHPNGAPWPITSPIDPVAPAAALDFALPPPYITPGAGSEFGQRGATFSAQEMLKLSAWTMPGTSQGWESLWQPYFDYVESHYAVYFTGLNSNDAVRVAAGNRPISDFETAGWTTWVNRNLLGFGSGDSPWEVRDLGFVNGGVLVAGNGASSYGGGGQRRGSVAHCRFTNTLAWGLATEDQRVVSVNVTHSQFEGCNGGIGNRYAQSDNWLISDCDFEGNEGIDLQIASANVTVDCCRFWGKPAYRRDYPFVHLKSLPGRFEVPGAVFLGTPVDDGPSGMRFEARTWYQAVQLGRGVRLIDCTFGHDGQCPEDLVVMGPWDVPPNTASDDIPRQANVALITPIETVAATGKQVLRVAIPPSTGNPNSSFTDAASAVLIEGCTFGAATVPAGHVRPRSAIRLATAAQEMAVIRCMAGDMSFVVFEQLQEQLWKAALGSAAASTLAKAAVPPAPTVGFTDIFRDDFLRLSNANRGNVLEVLPLPGIPRALEPFSFGGRGFEVVGSITAQLAGRSGFPGVLNLLASGKKHKYASPGTFLDQLDDDFSFLPTKLHAELNENSERLLFAIDPKALAGLSAWGALSAAGSAQRLPALPALVLAFEARSDDPSLQFGIAVRMGYFTLAGSPLRPLSAHADWQPVVLGVPSLPSSWQLPTARPAWLPENADWSQEEVELAKGGVADVFTDTTSRFPQMIAAIFWVVGENVGNGLEIRRLRLTVGDLPGPHRVTGRSALGSSAAGHAGWRSVPLGQQLVAAGTASQATDPNDQPTSAPVDILEEAAPAVGGRTLHVGVGTAALAAGSVEP